MGNFGEICSFDVKKKTQTRIIYNEFHGLNRSFGIMRDDENRIFNLRKMTFFYLVIFFSFSRRGLSMICEDNCFGMDSKTVLNASECQIRFGHATNIWKKRYILYLDVRQYAVMFVSLSGALIPNVLH